MYPRQVRARLGECIGPAEPLLSGYPYVFQRKPTTLHFLLQRQPASLEAPKTLSWVKIIDNLHYSLSSTQRFT